MGSDSMVEQILAEVVDCTRQVSTDSLIRAGTLIESSPRIFVAGAGRSGLCMRALGMRLMHLGKTVYVVGETTTPSIAASDLLILGSGSGRTASLLAMAEQAQASGRASPALHHRRHLAPRGAIQFSGSDSRAVAQVSRRSTRSHIGTTHGHPVRTIHAYFVRQSHFRIDAANRRQRRADV